MFLFTLSIIALLIAGCQQENERKAANESTDQTGIQVEEAWARPGIEGRMSAAYFLITNYGDEPDTLQAVQSDVARNVEVHESYEREEGMMGMREVTNLEIPAQSTLRFEQGGLHVMLIQLTRQLQDGDVFDLILTFKNHGEMVIDVSARL